MPRKNVSDKAKKISLSLPESLEAKSREIADNEFGGNLSKFIQKLIERHMSNREELLPGAKDPESLIKLFKQFLPPAQQTAEDWVNEHKLQQNLFISQLLLKINERLLSKVKPDEILKLLEREAESKITNLQAAEEETAFKRQL